MTVSWTWCSCTPTYGEKCPGCGERAMSRPDGLVHFTDTSRMRHDHWHVDCLLNHLTTPRAPMVKMEFTDEDLKEAMRQMAPCVGVHTTMSEVKYWRRLWKKTANGYLGLQGVVEVLTRKLERMEEALKEISSFKHMVDDCRCVSCGQARIALKALDETYDPGAHT